MPNDPHRHKHECGGGEAEKRAERNESATAFAEPAHLIDDSAANGKRAALGAPGAADRRLQSRVFELFQFLRHVVTRNLLKSLELRPECYVPCPGLFVYFTNRPTQSNYSRMTPSSMAKSRSDWASFCRARCRRLMTVPIGMSSASAISLYAKSSTAHNRSTV